MSENIENEILPQVEEQFQMVSNENARMYDELKRKEGDNPTIGILLCSETSEDIAR